MESGEDGGGSVESASDVAESGPYFHGFSVWFSCDAHESAESLGDEVVAGFVSVGSVLSVACDGAIDEVGA